MFSDTVELLMVTAKLGLPVTARMPPCVAAELLLNVSPVRVITPVILYAEIAPPVPVEANRVRKGLGGRGREGQFKYHMALLSAPSQEHRCHGNDPALRPSCTNLLLSSTPQCTLSCSHFQMSQTRV